MDNLLVFLGISILCFYFLPKVYNELVEILLISIGVISGTTALVFVIAIFAAPLEYNDHRILGESIRQELKTGSDLRTASLSRDIYEYNAKIKMANYYNSIWFFDSFWDDRFETLEPIKSNQ